MGVLQVDNTIVKSVVNPYLFQRYNFIIRRLPAFLTKKNIVDTFSNIEDMYIQTYGNEMIVYLKLDNEYANTLHNRLNEKVIEWNGVWYPIETILVKDRLQPSRSIPYVPKVTVEKAENTHQQPKVTIEKKANTHEESKVTVEKAETLEESKVTVEKAETLEESKVTVEKAETLEEPKVTVEKKANTCEEPKVTVEKAEDTCEKENKWKSSDMFHVLIIYLTFFFLTIYAIGIGKIKL
jgi:hypothetical protein